MHEVRLKYLWIESEGRANLQNAERKSGMTSAGWAISMQPNIDAVNVSMRLRLVGFIRVHTGHKKHQIDIKFTMEHQKDQNDNQI